MKNKLSIISAILVFVLSAICLFACAQKDDAPVAVDYKQDNSFAVNTVENDSALVFEPIADLVYGENGKSYKKVAYRYGVVFYVGTAIEPKYYTYLGEALAKQGYLVVMPKVFLNMAYTYYADTEKAFSDYPDVQFFIAGHAQGGGAAIRRASENAQNVSGAMLFAPLGYRHKLLDGNGNPVKDEATGVDKYVVDNLKDVDVPTLLIEAEQDRVLNDSMKEDAKSRLKDGYTHKVISPGAHMSFSTMDKDETLQFFNNDGDGITEDEKNAQRALTIQYSLEFMKNLTK